MQAKWRGDHQHSGIARRDSRSQQSASSDLQTAEKEHRTFRIGLTNHRRRCTAVALQAPKAQFLLSAMTG